MSWPKLMLLATSLSIAIFTQATASAAPAAAGAVDPIKQAVLSRQIRPLSRTAVDVTDKFPTRGDLWAVVTLLNAPHDTRLKAVVTAVNVGNAAPPNSKLAEDDATITDGSTNWPFQWAFNGLPTGTYKVDLYLNDKLDRTLNFSATDQALPPITAPKPAAIGSCPKLPPRNETAPGFALGVTMAQGRSGDGKPVNPGRIFRPDSPAFYAILSVQNAPANTRIAARWFATDVGGVDLCNAQFANYEIMTAGSGSPWFAANPPIKDTKWPEGLYRVEIYVNDRLTLNTDFGVCNGPCKFQSPLASQLP